MIARAKKYGYDGIEIDGKRPHGNPLDWPAARCRELRPLADGEGIDIFAVAANNDFSNPVPEVREAQICFVRDLIRMTADLGAPNAARVPGLVGRDASSATGHLRHRRGLLADRAREILHRGNLGLVPRCPGRVRPLRRRCRRDAGPAEPPAAHQGSSRRPADGQGSRLSAPEGLPRRSSHARQERGRDSPGGAGSRPAPGALALRRRIRATAGRIDPRLSSGTTASSAATRTSTTATSSAP